MAMRNWESLTAGHQWEEDPKVALLPVAAIEQHGPHLPLGTDAMICDGVIAAAGRHLNAATSVLRLPTQRIGVSPEHASFPGTLSMEPEVALAAWNAIGASVARAGLRRLVVFNSHGGQPGVVDQLAVRLRRDHGMLVARVNIFGLGLPDGAVGDEEARYGLHGGLVETSLMRTLHPDLVRMDLAQDFASRDRDIAEASALLTAEGPGIGIGWLAEDLNPAGVTGDAASATAELGERILDHLGAALARVLEDVGALEWPKPERRT
jgi:creatinine amidohydrolase